MRSKKIAQDKCLSLKKMLNNGEQIVAPGAYDAISAWLIQKAGFPCVYLGGHAQTASLLGLPDLALITLPEMRECIRRVAECVDLPIIVDADVGYGSLLLIQRTVREFEVAGACGIQIEDQPSPKRCGQTEGRSVVPIEEMTARIKAALAARRRPETLIIARTDARTSLGLEEAIKRGRTYAAAGADVIYVEAPESRQEMEDIIKAIDRPHMIDMVEGGLSPYLGWPELKEIGYSIAIYPASLEMAAAKTVQQVLEDISQKGRVLDWENKMFSLEEYHRLLEFEEFFNREKTFRQG